MDFRENGKSDALSIPRMEGSGTGFRVGLCELKNV